jgi:hypothetical protein
MYNHQNHLLILKFHIDKGLYLEIHLLISHKIWMKEICKQMGYSSECNMNDIVFH